MSRSIPHEPITQTLTRTYWRALGFLALVIGGVALAVGYGWIARFHTERLHAAAQAVTELLAAERQRIEALLTRTAENPLLRDGARFLDRYREEAEELAFFLPVAQEMSAPLLEIGQWLPADGLLFGKGAGWEVVLSSHTLWWRHTGSGKTFTVAVGSRLKAADGWPDGAPDTPASGWSWDPTHGRLLLTVTHEGKATRITVRTPLDPQALESRLARHGWALAAVTEEPAIFSLEVTAPPEQAARATAETVVPVANLLGVAIRQPSGPTLLLRLEERIPDIPLLVGVIAAAVAFAGLVIGVGVLLLRSGLRRTVIDPLTALQQAVVASGDDPTPLRELATDGWPAELVTLRTVFAEQWSLLRTRDAENRQLALALAHVGDGVVLTDRDERILYLNPAAEKILGYPLAEVKGKRPGEVWRSGEMPSEVYRLLHEALARGEEFSVTFRDRTRWGSVIDVEKRIAPVRDATGAVSGFVATFREVTERNHLVASLHAAQFTDSLTHLLNRLGLLEQLRGWFALNQAVTLAYCNLNGFAAVNIRWGAAAGDALLRRVAARLVALHEGWTTAHRPSLVAHLHADHFAVAWLGDGERNRDAVTELHDAVHALVEYEGDERVPLLTAAIGVAVAPQDGTTPEALLTAAEYAMQAAKGETGDAVQWYDARWGERQRVRAELSHRMVAALEQREFALFLQPVVSADGTLLAAEALMRWLPPGQPPVSPGEFIPLAEESGFINPLGAWAFDEALAIAATLVARGWPRPLIAVNVAPQQLTTDAFLTQVR